MSEKHRPIEALPDHEGGRYEAPEDRTDKLEAAPHREEHHDQLLEEARQEVTRHASGSEKDKVLDKLNVEKESDASEQEVSQRPINRELKKLTFAKEIKHIRHKLGKADQLGS